MVQGKKQLNSKPKFAEVVIGDNEAKEMRESANARNRRNPYLKSRCKGTKLYLGTQYGIHRILTNRLLSDLSIYDYFYTLFRHE